MNKFFNIENPFFAFFGKFADAVVLHILWLVCCLPVVTIGPATTALYYVLMKDIRNEGKHYYRMFFRSFKENFRKGFLLGIIFLLVAGVLVYSAFMYKNLYDEVQDGFMDGMTYVTAGLLAVWIMFFTYVAALTARFENTIPKTLVNALLLMVKNIGWTFLMILLAAAFYFVIIYFSQYLFILIIPGYGFIALVNSYILNRIFKPFVENTEAEEAENETEAEG